MNSPKVSFARALGVAVLFTLTNIVSVAHAADAKMPAIFNGKDLTGWKADGATEFWRVENGVLICESNAAKKGSMLWTEASYTDFVMEFDVRWKSDTERGIDTGVEMRKPAIQ
jgi:hypothetical protein